MGSSGKGPAPAFGVVRATDDTVAVELLDLQGLPVGSGRMRFEQRLLFPDAPLSQGLYIARFANGARWRIALAPSGGPAGSMRVSSLELPPARG